MLETPEFRRGGVDTGWLDRLGAEARAGAPYAGRGARRGGDPRLPARAGRSRGSTSSPTPTTITPARIPPSEGQRVDLTHRGRTYELRVYAIGSWRYRVHLDGRAVTATLREEGRRAGRLQLGSRSLRVLYDPTEAGIRVEIEGRPHRFGWQLAGEVRASTPAMVISIDVAPGDRVEAGQPLGFLEAMKMEIGFEAPVAGVVKEVRARRGQQVAAGEVLLVIEPAGGDAPSARPGERIALPPIGDPLASLFRLDADGDLGEPDLAAADAADAEARREALEGIREEVRRVFLGYDANPARAERLAAFLEAELPADLSEGFRWELAALRHELQVVADVDQLFIRSPRDSVAGDLGVSNSARLRMFVRRIRASGAGLAPEFLELARRALAQYGVARLEHSDALERAVLRLLATQHSRELRRRLLLAVLRCVTHLAESGIHLGDDRALQDALLRLAGMRGLVSDAVADAALEAGYVIFERPQIERQAERTSKRLEAWLAAVEAEPTAPPEEVLRHLIEAPRAVFDRVGGWLADPDPRRRAIALAAHLRRLYAPAPLAAQASELRGEAALHRLELSAGRVVIGGTCAPAAVAEAAARLCEAAAGERDRHEFPAVYALELLVPGDGAVDLDALARRALGALGGALPAARFTLSVVVPEGPDRHVTFVASREGPRVDAVTARPPPGDRRPRRPRAPRALRARALRGAGRRLRLPRAQPRRARRRADLRAGRRARALAGRGPRGLALRARLRARLPRGDARAARAPRPARPAAAAAVEPHHDLRGAGGLPRARPRGAALAAARAGHAPPRHREGRRAPSAPRPERAGAAGDAGRDRDHRHHGLEHGDRVARRRGASPLQPRTDYERRVAEARRRRLVYPYEIVRMLTGSGRTNGQAGGDAALPVGQFSRSTTSTPRPPRRGRAASTGARSGATRARIVFGLIRTPTEKVPEGMERVLVLSDPTRGMGALAAPECDRVVAAIDLAEERGAPGRVDPRLERRAHRDGQRHREPRRDRARRAPHRRPSPRRGGTIHVIVARRQRRRAELLGRARRRC